MRKLLFGLVVAIGAIAAYWVPISAVKAIGTNLSLIAVETQPKTPTIVKPVHCRLVWHCHRRGHLRYCHRCG
jgi:hypothetical protein